MKVSANYLTLSVLLFVTMTSLTSADSCQVSIINEISAIVNANKGLVDECSNDSGISIFPPPAIAPKIEQVDALCQRYIRDMSTSSTDCSWWYDSWYMLYKRCDGKLSLVDFVRVTCIECMFPGKRELPLLSFVGTRLDNSPLRFLISLLAGGCLVC